MDIRQSTRVSRNEVTEDVVQRCSGYMVVVDKQMGKFRPAHLTVTEFMQSRNSGSGRQLELDLHIRAAKTCLRVLGELASSRTSGSVSGKALKLYSIIYWATHIQLCRTRWDEELQKLISKFFGTAAAPSEAYLHWYREAHVWQKELGDTSNAPLASQIVHVSGDPINPLCASAIWGIYVPSLWDAGFDVGYRNTRGETLVYLASTCHHYGIGLECGHVQILRTLIEHGADANAEGGYDGYALARAVQSKDVRLVSMLLEAGARTDVRASEFSSALQLAVFKKAGDVAQLLIDRGKAILAVMGLRLC